MLHTCMRALINQRGLPAAAFLSCSRPVITRLYASYSHKEMRAFDAGSSLEVQHPRWPHALHLSYLWLRDHCRCSRCFNHLTAQRIFDPACMQLNIRPAKVSATPDGLEVTWPDGHNSTYEYKFLWQNTYEGRHTSHRSPHQLWTGNTAPKPELNTVTMGELSDPKKAGLKKLVEAIIKYGFGFISEVPVDMDSTRSAVESVCEVKRTFFGEVWSMTSGEMDHKDTAYTSEYIGSHTDSTYFTCAPRIQVFHCLETSPEGGETLLMDGFNVAKQFKDKHSEGYAFFSSNAFPSEYIEEGRHYACLGTVFRHNSETGALAQFRYNIYDRAPLSTIPLEKMQEYYLHFKNLAKVIRSPKNKHWIKLEPGTVLLLDNWRVMHGRDSFSGRRVMTGCYLDNDDFISTARVLGLQVE